MQGSAEVAQLEQLVGVFYSGAEQSQIAFAAASLDELRSRWWHAGPWLLLEQTVGAHASAPTVLWTSSLVEQWVRKRWHRISDSDRAACRASLVNLVSTSAAAAAAAASAAAASAAAAASTSEPAVLSRKLQHVLALLLRADWPAGWSTFIPDLLGAPNLDDPSRLRVLLMLAEEANLCKLVSHSCLILAPPESS